MFRVSPSGAREGLRSASRSSRAAPKRDESHALNGPDSGVRPQRDRSLPKLEVLLGGHKAPGRRLVAAVQVVLDLFKQCLSALELLRGRALHFEFVTQQTNGFFE